MKLLHVFSIFETPESFFDGQFRYLADQGYELHLICSRAEGKEAFLERNRVHYMPVEIYRAISLRNDFKAIQAVCRYIRKNNIEAVFGHTPKGAVVAMMAAWLAGVKTRVYYRHGLIYTTTHSLKRFILKAEEQFVSLLATKIVNVSPSLSTLAVKDFLNGENKQCVIGRGTCGGIDAENIFNPQLLKEEKLVTLRRDLGIKDSDIVFGFCGRLTNDKGIPELLDAFELFQKQHARMKAKLLLIGRLDSRDSLSAVVLQKMKNNTNIVVTDFVNKSEIAYYYALLDTFVFPSHREGFGMSVLEASAMELPILVSRSHGCVDSIIENKTGLYIPLDPEGICKGMNKMLDANLRQSLGQEGRRMVLQYFNYRVMWPMVGELYDRILKHS